MTPRETVMVAALATIVHEMEQGFNSIDPCEEGSDEKRIACHIASVDYQKYVNTDWGSLLEDVLNLNEV